jgi:peroxiredoxin
MNLATELAAFKDSFLLRVPKERSQMIQRYIDQSRSDAVAASALRAGDRAPNFSLPNQVGLPVELATRLKSGPAIVTFYRGGWCPYCNLELRAYQQLLPEMRAHGVTLLAISPQTPDASLSTAEKNALEFDVLCDLGGEVARAFGIVYALPDELRALYTQVGHALPDLNGDESWTLPVPATFVIGDTGLIKLAHVELDYRLRLEPSTALAVALGASEARAA